MLNVTEVLASIVGERADAHYAALFRDQPLAALDWVQRAIATALRAIGGSDALYHNAEHTAHVTLVGLEILKAKAQMETGLTATIWANTVVALLCHDIGYVRGLCRADNATTLSTGVDGQTFKNVDGSSDAIMMPVHVNRGKRYVEESFVDQDLADIEFINGCIERTRFPVPDDPWYARTDDYPGLVRAADLIGQLSDPRYLSKLAAIFFEFEETGFNQRVGYECPGDLLIGYPAFFENSVQPYIGAANRYLKRNPAGREILEHLYANLETARHASSLPLASVS